MKVIAYSFMFLMSGLISAYFFSINEEWILINGLFPGMIFTSTTILIFLIERIQVVPKYWIIYYLLMYVTYLIVFFLTLYSGSLGMITGLILAGYGAYVTFKLVGKYIVKIEFSPGRVFLLGTVSFLVNDVLLFVPIKKIIQPVYEIDTSINSLFAPSLLIWQVVVGTALSGSLTRHPN